MKFGVFDHLDASGAPLDRFFEDRLKLGEAYDQAPIHSYHVAEHHATPLGLSPSPSVFLAALAQRTKRVRFGPIVYTLPLYHPLRLADEICMLDQLSNGRLDLGVGRGVSPIEFEYFGVDLAKDSQPMYLEAYAVLMQALTKDRVTFEGKYYQYRDVPIMLKPKQQPLPPLWYGLSNIESTEWAARTAINTISNQPVERVKATTDRFRAEWAKLGRDPAKLPFLGFTRHCVIGETEAEAKKIAKRAYTVWYGSFIKLWRERGQPPTFLPYVEDFDETVKRGQMLCGTPDQVAEIIQRQSTAAGINYLLLRFAFGNLKLDESVNSLGLFARRIQPAYSK